MRTTLDLDDTLLARAKAEAARQRTTLTRLIEEGLALRLAHDPSDGEPRPPFRLDVFRGGRGFAPGVDPTRNASLVDAADGSWLPQQAGLAPTTDDGPDDAA